MLGNDVVDLLDVDARPESFHRRFDARVFTPGERDRIARDANPQALRWAHWAAKEAAYKCLRQRDPAFVFSPIRLEARFDVPAAGSPLGSTRSGRLALIATPAPGTSEPEFENFGTTDSISELASFGTLDSILELVSFETLDYVHVLARPSGADWREVVTAVEPLARPDGEGGDDASAAVRRLALREIARTVGGERTGLTIGREGRIPILERDGERMPIALSLSHHGRFVAFAAARPAHGPRLVRRGRNGSTTENDGPARSEMRRGETDDGQVPQAVGAVGCPARRVDGERKTG